MSVGSTQFLSQSRSREALVPQRDKDFVENLRRLAVTRIRFVSPVSSVDMSTIRVR